MEDLIGFVTIEIDGEEEGSGESLRERFAKRREDEAYVCTMDKL